VGEKRRLWIPPALAYGETPGMGAPAGQLTFDVELLEILQTPKPWPVPTDVKEAPKAAKKTSSGLAYKLLTKGKGTKHPAATERVTVHYAGWTPDGKQFDSSVTRGEPATFPLNGVIKGWTEGVQLMVEGDKMRFWIPSELAYGDKPTRPGAPSGPLVFDVELISIGGGGR
jgi:peptidylprolyl isomerase